jgi:hypothetical protein
MKAHAISWENRSIGLFPASWDPVCRKKMHNAR